METRKVPPSDEYWTPYTDTLDNKPTVIAAELIIMESKYNHSRLARAGGFVLGCLAITGAAFHSLPLPFGNPEYYRDIWNRSKDQYE